MVKILMKIIFSNVRNVRFIQSKLVGIEILYNLSLFMGDNENLRIALPLISVFFEDQDSIIICQAYTMFCKILSRLKEPYLNYEDTLLFLAFIWQNILHIYESQDINV